MKKLNAGASKHLGQVGITILAFLCLNWLNEIAFLPIEQSNGVNWVFIPAGVRLLSSMLFGLAGFDGLLLASLYLNFFHFRFDSDFRAGSGAVAAALGPYLASLLFKHWFDLEPRLKRLTAHRLLFTGVLCGLLTPVFHHTFMWILTGRVDWTALAAMIIGDTTGIFIVLGVAKGAMSLADRHPTAGHLIRRWTSGDGTETR